MSSVPPSPGSALLQAGLLSGSGSEVCRKRAASALQQPEPDFPRFYILSCSLYCSLSASHAKTQATVWGNTALNSRLWSCLCPAFPLPPPEQTLVPLLVGPWMESPPLRHHVEPPRLSCSNVSTAQAVRPSPRTPPALGQIGSLRSRIRSESGLTWLDLLSVNRPYALGGPSPFPAALTVRPYDNSGLSLSTLLLTTDRGTHHLVSLL